MFLGLKKRLEKNKTLIEDYDKFMQTMLDNNFEEEIPFEELVVEEGKSWYLNHHSVYHKQKHIRLK